MRDHAIRSACQPPMRNGFVPCLLWRFACRFLSFCFRDSIIAWTDEKNRVYFTCRALLQSGNIRSRMAMQRAS
jgi:hypothetical protein